MLLFVLLGGGCESVQKLKAKLKGTAQDAGTLGAAPQGGDGGGGAPSQADQGGAADGGGSSEQHAEAGDDDGGAHADGGRPPEHEVEADYTPRRLQVDEEECDDAARDALSRLRQRASALAEKEQALKHKEEELIAQRTAHKIATERIEERIKDLTRLSAEIDQKLSAREDGAGSAEGAKKKRMAQADREERVLRVAKMVGGMAPQKAASLLGSFKDDDLAVDVLQSLPQEMAGKVLGKMRPESAARLAERIGGGGEKEGAKQ